ncbi:hypothetical protein AB0I72_15550 [Nocardiopsis sp. NPDC049922]|uniref:hypothetical protein n=1 Tax=Nocardiopsis sp. NPDC049922 TaxID=3155157 RepID=UPI0033DE5929
MKGVGFIPLLWVARAMNEGLFPSYRSIPVAVAIANAVDADGRWCFLSHGSLVERCGGTMSRSTVERALKDLAGAGLIRRLSRAQVRVFFSDDVEARLQAADRLPGVLELLVPASVFAEQTLAEINEVRAALGEDPLDATTRPYPPVATARQIEASPVQIDVGDTSDRRTDLFPTHPYPSDPSPSVRRPRPPDAAPAVCLPQLERIPDAVLGNPHADRTALDRAAREVLDDGLTPDELTAVLSDATTARRPFPALMRRLRSPEDARAFLDGRLGRGVHGHPPSPFAGIPRPRSGDDPDPFARPPEFLVDAAGTAPRTCPGHPAIRNVPGGTCRLCERPCRTVPNELMHPPTPAKPPRPTPEPPMEDVAVDPALLARARASLDEGKHRPSVPPPNPPAHSPARREAVAEARRRLEEARTPARVPRRSAA